MRHLLLILFFVSGPLYLSAQQVSGDSILASERAIDRPITMHKGQLRSTGGYGLNFISRRYDIRGESVDLAEDGIANSIRHRFAVDLRYGVNDYIQINTAIGYSTETVRQKTDYIVPSGPEPMVSHDVTRRYTGLEDLYVGVDLRAPLKTRKVDVAVALGLTLPLSPFEQEKPKHSFQSAEGQADAIHQFIYRYEYPRGTGITVARLGSFIKYRTARWAFSGRVDYAHGLKEGSGVEWRHQLNDDGTFDYRRDTFTYRLADSFSYYGELEYQAGRWLDVFLNASGHTAYRGWTSSQEDLKVATPYETSWVVSPGAEIMVTPRWWVRGRIDFSVAGKSFEAPLSTHVSAMYNVFPF